ncbi:hypothetical protein KDA11_05905, partial [Candidatus Saccharibacteria bacterium]|nr:hypothetical protein [Candidatus Saccharibacteria bacterium]
DCLEDLRRIGALYARINILQADLVNEMGKATQAHANYPMATIFFQLLPQYLNKPVLFVQLINMMIEILETNVDRYYITDPEDAKKYLLKRLETIKAQSSVTR